MMPSTYLFSEFTIRNVTLPNRIVMAPMCMYSADHDGKVNDFHYVHYISRAVGQVGLIMVEATGVTPQGRITGGDLGIWDDSHIEGLASLADGIHKNGAIAGIQLAHAGRKGTSGSTVITPSAVAYKDNMKTPVIMTNQHIEETFKAFKDGALRAKKAGFDVIEIHAAHGYLINEFLSPLTNKREDSYGGNEENRYRFLGEIIDEVRSVWDGPLFIRISANEYNENGTSKETYIDYGYRMKEQGVDLIDCSSGAVVPANIPIYPGYQVPYSEMIRQNVNIATGAVGLITSGLQAEEIIRNNRADLIFLGRELLRNPYWPRTAAIELKTTVPIPEQYVTSW
jgi:NADPH2 dehydrogenase